MERLWAPWRLAFIEGKEGPSVPADKTGCIFCDYPRPFTSAPPSEEEREHQRACLVVHGRQHAFVILNKYPYNNGHIMVVPRAHVGSLDALPPDAFLELHVLLKDAANALKQAYKPDGINIGMNLGRAAGAGIADHMHYHLVPRWVGDANFMPILGDTKVLSESLWDTYDRLQKVLGP
ncbi:MAG: HIT domain-containing protein [Myxococcota bacterium]